MNIFAPAPHIARLPEDEVRRQYPWFRWQVLEATFIGYAMYYLVRNNLSVVAKDIEGALLYDKSMMGDLLAMTAISYGVGKFVMGAWSDRSNPRTFMAFGLLFTALLNFAFGASSDYWVHFALWSVNGFIQGMGWPPCGRSMGHWFGAKERGFTFSIWNTSHNVGGGLAGIIAAEAAGRMGGWQYAFYVPGFIALFGAAYLFFRLRDTPQSVGLPPIEEYLGDKGIGAETAEDERELSFKELMLDHVFLNKYIWLLAFANFFAYIARYSMMDWGPMYLREVKHATLSEGGIAVFLQEFGGIPSTILLGWLSDKIGGRRGMVATLSMVPIVFAFMALIVTPPGYLWFDMAMLTVIGLCIYPVINLIVIIALDTTSKKAIGAAAGFIGLFGYIGRTVQAKGFGGMLDHYQPLYGDAVAWNMVLWTIVGASVSAVIFLAVTWNMRPSHEPKGTRH
jgi:OPA family glycerol-3-phosphate transporter-like MFS transporter